MTRIVYPAPTPDAPQLRELLAAVLPELLGGAVLAVPRLPAAGEPMLLFDGDLPLLACFHPTDPGQALLSALTAAEEVSDRREWIATLCSQVPQGARWDELRLVVLLPAPPPGGSHLSFPPERTALYTFRPVRSGDEVALLVEPWVPEAPAKSAAPSRAGFRTGEVGLTDEEAAFFKER